MKKQGYKQKDIAFTIGKDKSVVSREVNRNCDKRNKKYLVYFSLSILFIMFLFQKSFAQGFYDPSLVSNINIDFYDSNWDYKLDSLMLANSDDRILADITINGVLFDSCGVRYKGNSSYSSSNIKILSILN